MNAITTTTTALEMSDDPTSEIIELHERIEAAGRRTKNDGIRIGELLHEQKARLPHGQFMPWVRDSLPFSHKTATTYMAIYEHRDDPKLEAASNLTSAARLLVEHRPEPEPEVDGEPLRAERRIGELTRELPKAPTNAKAGRGKVGPTPGLTSKSTALAAQGIPKRAASRYEAAAEVPELDEHTSLDEQRAAWGDEAIADALDSVECSMDTLVRDMRWLVAVSGMEPDCSKRWNAQGEGAGIAKHGDMGPELRERARKLVSQLEDLEIDLEALEEAPEPDFDDDDEAVQ